MNEHYTARLDKPHNSCEIVLAPIPRMQSTFVDRFNVTMSQLSDRNRHTEIYEADRSCHPMSFKISIHKNSLDKYVFSWDDPRLYLISWILQILIFLPLSLYLSATKLAAISRSIHPFSINRSPRLQCTKMKRFVDSASRIVSLFWCEAYLYY